MALVVEDGTGLSTAESYISVADAVTYLDNRAGSSNSFSSEGTTANQEAALRVATEWIDHYGLMVRPWKGYRANKTQALAWPRYSVYDQDGYLVASTAVPTAVARATAEMALRYLESASTAHGTSRLEPDVGSPGAILREKVDVIETEYAAGGAGQLTSYTRVIRMLAGLVRPAGEPIIA